MSKDRVEQFDADMRRIVALLEKGDNESARRLFNADVFPKYRQVQSTDTQDPLSRVILFFYDLDEFLNNPSVKELKVSVTEDIIGSYYSDYQEDLKRARSEEASARTLNELGP